MLLASCIDLWQDDPQFEIMELYAGAARITRLAKAIGLAACAHDVCFDTNTRSSFNLLDNAGFLFPNMFQEAFELSNKY